MRSSLCCKGGVVGASGNIPSNTKNLSVPFFTQSVYFSFFVTLRNALFSIKVAYTFLCNIFQNLFTNLTRCRSFKYGKTPPISCAIFDIKKQLAVKNKSTYGSDRFGAKFRIYKHHFNVCFLLRVDFYKILISR